MTVGVVNEIIQELKISYAMEIETVENYLANSINLDGVRAEEIKENLAKDTTEELGHARQLGSRIRTLEGSVPGSQSLSKEQGSLQPPEDSTDVVSVIKGVIEAEEGAISQYKRIIKLCDGVDYVTQDLCITLLSDEEEHRRLFSGFLKEFEK